MAELPEDWRITELIQRGRYKYREIWTLYIHFRRHQVKWSFSRSDYGNTLSLLYSKFFSSYLSGIMKGFFSLLGLFALAMIVIADEAAFRSITQQYKNQLRTQLPNSTYGCTGRNVAVRREWFQPRF